MRLTEGRGFLARTAVDAPWAAALSFRMLTGEGEEAAFRVLASLLALAPGGLHLVWDLPGVPPAELLRPLPGLNLHLREDALPPLEAPAPLWVHGSRVPEGAGGEAFRRGWLGWVPDAPDAWHLPGFGAWEAEAPAYLWGDLVLSFAALAAQDPEALARMLGEHQAALELALSLRTGAGAWPGTLPFLRRRTRWRLALLGGREFQLSGGTWEEASERIAAFREALEGALRAPVQVGLCEDAGMGLLLGRQAMREGLPWRGCLPLPPAAPAFTPGAAADPREPGPLEARAAFPLPLAACLDHPPVAWLRVPTVPGEAAVAAFLRGHARIPAMRWLPPELPPPGPFLPEKPWAAASAFVPLADVTQALQPGLFEGLDS